MKNNKNNNINIKSIWKTIRSKKVRRYAFIIFYIFFFIFLFIFMTTNNSSNKPVDNNYSFPYNIKYLENKNYNFKYLVNYNNNDSLYNGKKINNQIILNDDRGEYKFEYQNGILIRTNNLELNVPYYKLIDVYEIKKILKNSKLISETKLNETKEYIYNYKIKNKYLNEIFDNNSNLDLENNIIIKTNSLKEVKEINIDLLNYEKEKDNLVNKYMIEIIYGDINE